MATSVLTTALRSEHATKDSQLQQRAATVGGAVLPAARLEAGSAPGAAPAARHNGGSHNLSLAQAVGAATLPLYLYPAALRTHGEGEARAAPSSGLSSDPSFMATSSVEFEDGEADLLAVPDVADLARLPHAWSAMDLVAMVGDGGAGKGFMAAATPGDASDTTQHRPSCFEVPSVQAAMSPYLRAMSDDGCGALGQEEEDVEAVRGGDTGISSSPSSPLLLPSGASDMMDEQPGSPGAWDGSTGSSSMTSQATVLDSVLTALWDDADARGLFRYSVAAAMNRVVPGKWGWVAQLNEGRGSKKRATELRADAVLQPFDASKFHFGKADVREALLAFEALPPAMACGVSGWRATRGGARMVESAGLSPDPSLVVINVSPIDYGHILLLPRVLAQQPQALHAPGLSAALAFIREVGNPSFRLGYNSLGAYATINHLHFQGYYLSDIMPCQRAATAEVPGFTHPTLRVSTLVDYPVRGWVVERKAGDTRAPGVTTAESDMAALIGRMAGVLQASDQPFNVLFVEQGRRAFIWPQCYAERQAAGVVPQDMLDTGVNPAVFEVAGHLVLKRSQDFECATDEWGARLLAGVSLPELRFAALTARVLGMADGAATTA